MSAPKFLPRRYVVNFVDGSAEFHDTDLPPAEEYLSLTEHEALIREAKLSLWTDISKLEPYKGCSCIYGGGFNDCKTMVRQILREGKE